jgi:tRNA(Ile)-lysidine synthase
MSGSLIEQTIVEFLHTHPLHGQKLVVGVSGGADSLALLHGLRGAARGLLTAVHVDHGLRENSAEDARYVQQTCSAWQIPSVVKQLTLTATSEEAARRERYLALSQAANEVGATAILTAHHADDQVETVLMNLVRGTGIDGLCGMSAVSPVPYTVDEAQRLYRPLLTLTRPEILAYCQQHNITFVEDVTNQERRYFRNRIRHELLPTLEQHAPQIRKRLLQLAALSSADAALLANLTQESCANILISTGLHWRELDLIQWRALPLGLRRRTLRSVLHALDGTLADVGFATIEEARSVAERGHVGKQATLPNGWLLTVGYDRLRIGARDAAPALDVPQILGQQRLAVPGAVGLGAGWVISAELVPSQPYRSVMQQSSSMVVFIPHFDKLTVRARQVGERMHPFGASGSAKLKRIMIDRKIPQHVRANWPLVIADDQVVWIVGEVLGEIGRIEPHTNQSSVKLTLKRAQTPLE